MSILSPNDFVFQELRTSARRLGAVAIFSGAINLSMLSGSFYMLQVYDRVLPSRNVATLIGLSTMLLIAYLFQGYFEAARSRMLSRIGALFDIGLQKRIYLAIATLPLRGAKAIIAQQPLRDLDQFERSCRASARRRFSTCRGFQFS